MSKSFEAILPHLLANRRNGVTISTLAERTELSRSTIIRTLKALGKQVSSTKGYYKLTTNNPVMKRQITQFEPLTPSALIDALPLTTNQIRRKFGYSRAVGALLHKLEVEDGVIEEGEDRRWRVVR
jgi:biotin operon repressor